MRTTVYLLGMTLLLLQTACVKQHAVYSSSLQSEQSLAYKKLVIYGVDEIPVESYVVLGRERGLSCDQDIFWGKVSKDEAMEHLKIRAAMVRAEALTNVVCEYKKAIDVESQCLRAWVCVGDAIHITSPMLIPRPLERVTGPRY